MSTETPYLSLVVTARNDDHGGNPLGRMQAFVSGWIAQAKRHGIPSELILVEWNPPPDRPRLREALHWPEDLGPCEIRFIEVPAELHRRYAHAEALALYQMIAKNAGIRRARGRFVLATNIDILFSDELAAFFAARRLEDGRMYRIARHDAMSDVPADYDEQARTALGQAKFLAMLEDLTPSDVAKFEKNALIQQKIDLDRERFHLDQEKFLKLVMGKLTELQEIMREPGLDDDARLERVRQRVFGAPENVPSLADVDQRKGAKS